MTNEDAGGLVSLDGKYGTKSGQPARALCVDRLGHFPVVGLVGMAPSEGW